MSPREPETNVRTKRLMACLGLLVLGIALVPVAHAFNYRFLRTSVLEKLTAQDIEIGTKATYEALESGKGTDWINPGTGAKGTVRIVETLDVDDHKGCRRTFLSVSAGGRDGSGTYTLCRTAAGAWNFYAPKPR